MGRRYVVDLETDGLLKSVTKCWMVNTLNIDTGVKRCWLDGDLGWKKVLDEASLIVGYNIIGYDFIVLEKLFGYKLPKTVMVHDAMIFSLITNYKRFPEDNHKLETWGVHLGLAKIDFHDFSHYSQEMHTYGDRDLDLTLRVYNQVLKEFQKIAAVNPNIRVYTRAEHAVAKWCAQAELHGWPFDMAAAVPLLAQIEKLMNETRDKLTPLLGWKTVAVDKKNGIVIPKETKWTRIGAYHAANADWFNIDPYSGQDEDRLLEGPYSRVEFKPLDLDSIADVKIFLYRNGWEPTEWNTKFDEASGRKVKTSAKITEDSLECMADGGGKIYCEFLTNKSRHSILKGWIENCDENNRLHGDCFVIGTPSMRARHSIIVNVPAADSVFGPEMRRLFTVIPGWKLIGCDSAGNQARGLAHYLKSEEYIKTLLTGDIHRYNAKILDEIITTLGASWNEYLIAGDGKRGVPPKRLLAKLQRFLKSKGIAWAEYLLSDRPTASRFIKAKRGRSKRVLYAFLFGAAGGKMWSYIFDKQNDVLGKKLKTMFIKAVPGFKALLEKLGNIYGKTSQFGNGYIPGLGGNRIYCDSFHKLLVYLLQASEKATCSAAVMLTMERLESAGIPYQPCIMMHDEEDFMVPEEHAEAAAKIGKQAFIDGPKMLGIVIMDGEAKIGNNWYEVH